MRETHLQRRGVHAREQRHPGRLRGHRRTAVGSPGQLLRVRVWVFTANFCLCQIEKHRFSFDANRNQKNKLANSSVSALANLWSHGRASPQWRPPQPACCSSEPPWRAASAGPASWLAGLWSEGRWCPIKWAGPADWKHAEADVRPGLRRPSLDGLTSGNAARWTSGETEEGTASFSRWRVESAGV